MADILAWLQSVEPHRSRSIEWFQPIVSALHAEDIDCVEDLVRWPGERAFLLGLSEGKAAFLARSIDSMARKEGRSSRAVSTMPSSPKRSKISDESAGAAPCVVEEKQPHDVARALRAEEALAMLREGNLRYKSCNPKCIDAMDPVYRESLDRDTLHPMAIVLGCADSRVPVERVFDTREGEVYVIRSYGFTSGGAMLGEQPSPGAGPVGSMEFCLEQSVVRPPLLLVLGHLQSDAVAEAVRRVIAERNLSSQAVTTSRCAMRLIFPAAQDAVTKLPHADIEEVIALAVELNVWHTIETALNASEHLRAAVRGGLQIHCAIHDIVSGDVKFLGQHPNVAALCERPVHYPFRTARDPPIVADEALARLYIGNRLFRESNRPQLICEATRRQLSVAGQNPMAVVVGCADSRVPIELLFGMSPGDLFVLRNAGNVIATGTGSLVGSAEYAVAHLHTRLLLVLGHTKCGAVQAIVSKIIAEETEESNQGAKEFHPSSRCRCVQCVRDATPESAKGPLDMLLDPLIQPAIDAMKALGRDAPLADIVALATELNVKETMKKFLQLAPSVRRLALEGVVQVRGGIYDLDTAKVRFLPPLEDTETVLGGKVPLFSWKCSPYIRAPFSIELPKAVDAGAAVGGDPRPRRISTISLVPGRSNSKVNDTEQSDTESLPLFTRVALTRRLDAKGALIELMKGNARYLTGANCSRMDAANRAAFGQYEQNPFVAILGPSDSRVAVERIFDAGLGSLMVQRNSGACAGSTAIQGFEHAVTRFPIKLLVVLSHTRCNATRSALRSVLGEDLLGGKRNFASVLPSTCRVAPAALAAVRQVEGEEFGTIAGKNCRIFSLATELGVFYSIERMLMSSEILREACRDGLEMHGAIYDVRSGGVSFIGQHPCLEELIHSQRRAMSVSRLRSLS